MSEFVLQKDLKEISEGLEDVAQEFSGKTILMTGSRGFLGRYISETFHYLNEHVLDKPCKFIGADNFITAGKLGESCIDRPGQTFIKHNVIEPLSIEEDVDFILHSAGIASPFYYRANPLMTLDVAVLGSKHMLELARQKRAKYLFFSSSEIYGDPDPENVPTGEQYRGNVACLGPRACYDESKRLGETLCQIYHQEYGVHTNMVRPFNVFGPGMQENDYRVLPNFASRIKKKQALKVYGSGNQTRTFCYISDAIGGFLRIAAKGVPGEPYNIGNPKPEISMLDLAKEIQRTMEIKVSTDVIEYPDSYPADEPNRRCPDIRKAQLQLGYDPQVSLSQGLRRFFDWALENYSDS
ncbi:MAG: NAD-dependent epimerase/dehydratase family protein [Pseudobacteriovorax sp.]|nr:NAD-dependent epimerase/dehydratase family protein [Pseudobacteriovorax sp.]